MSALAATATSVGVSLVALPDSAGARPQSGPIGREELRVSRSLSRSSCAVGALVAAVALLGSGAVNAQSTSPSGGPTVAAVPSAGCRGSESRDLAWEISLTVDGVARSALIHLPASLAAGDPRPLVLSFHGYGSGAYDQEARSGLSTEADAARFVVAYPQGLGDPPAWDLEGDTDTAFVSALVDLLEDSLCLDRQRVFATGFSMGGGMANVLGCRQADRFAAIGPVSAIHGETWGGPCTPARPVPVIAFHGMRDPALPYEGGELVAFPDWAGRPVTGVEDWVSDWARIDGCSPEPLVSAVADDVASLAWQGCRAQVVLYRVTDGGHTWPGGVNDPNDGISTDGISATGLLWSFFDRHPGQPAGDGS